METSQTFNFNIPKLKRQATKDNLLEIDPKSRDAKEILSNVTRSYLDQNYCGPWQIQAIHSVRNTELEQDYRSKRTELKEEGRHSRELSDQIAFYAIRDPLCVPKIAKNGLTTNNLPFSIIGDHNSGTYLSKHADISLQMVETISNQLTTALFVFNVLTGKCKPVNERSMSSIEPTPNYDCHVGLQPPQLSDIHIIQMQRSQIYLYEYDEDGMPAPRPRHCLPYAVITYERKANTIVPGSISKSIYIYDPTKGPPPSKKSDEKNDWKKGPRHPVPFKNVPNNPDPNNRMLPGIRPSLLGPGLPNRDHMLQNVFPQDPESGANEQCRMLASLFLGYGPQPPLPDVSQKVLVQRSGSDPRMKCRQDQTPLDAEHCPPPVDNSNFSMENNGQFMPQFYIDDMKTDINHIWGQPNTMHGYGNEPADQMNWYPLPYSRPLLQNEVDPQCLGDQHPWKHDKEAALNKSLNQYEANSQSKPANSDWYASGSEFFENKDWKNSYLNNCDNKISSGFGTTNSTSDTSNATTTTTTTSNSSCSSSNAKSKRPIPFALNKKKPASSNTETKVCEKKSSDIELPEKTVQDLLDRLPTVKKEPFLHHTDVQKKSSGKNQQKALGSVSKNQSESELLKKGSSKMSDNVTSVTFPKSGKSSSEVESSSSCHAIKGQDSSMHELMMQLLSSQENESLEFLSNKKLSTSKLKNKKSEESTKKPSLNKLSIEDLKKLKDYVQSKLKASKEYKSGLTNSTPRITPKIKNTAPSGKTGLKTTILLPTVADHTEETAPQLEALSKLLSTVESTIEVREQPLAPTSSKGEVAVVSEFEKKYKSFLHRLRKRQIKNVQSHKPLQRQEGMLCDEIPPAATDAVGIDDVVNTKLMKELLLLDQENSESTSVSEADSLYLPPSERKKKRCSMASRSLLTKKAPFDMTGYRRRRKRQKMRRKASEFDSVSLASTTSGDKMMFRDNTLLSDLNKDLDLDFPMSDFYLEQEKSLLGEEIPLKRTPTLKELGYDDWKTAMFSVRFQPVVALNDCIKQITNHLKREGTSSVMNWIGSHQDLMNALNIPEQPPNTESLSKSLSSTTFQITSKSESATNVKLSKMNSKASPPVSKAEFEEFGSTIDITSLKNDAKRKFASKCEKANKQLKSSSGDSFKRKIKVAKDKFSCKSPPKEKQVGVDKKVSSILTASKPDKEKKSSATPVPSKKPATTTHSFSSTSSVQSKSNLSILAKTTTTTTTSSSISSSSSSTTTVPKSIMKTSRAEPVTKGTAITPSTFPATDQSLKVDLLLDSIIEPPPVVVTEPKKPKSVISFEAYKEKRLKPKSPPREKINVFDSLQDIFPAEKESPIFDKPKPEKPLLETFKDIEVPNLFSNLATTNLRDPRLVASQKEPPSLMIPPPKLPLPMPKVIPPLMSVNPILPMGIPPLLPVNPPLPPLLMPSLQKSVPLLKGNSQLNKSTPQSPKIIPQCPKIIPSTNKPLSSGRDDSKIFPKNKPLSKKPSLPKTIPTSVTVSLKDPREQVGLVDPRLAKNPSLAASKGPASQAPPSQDIHSSKEESVHDPSLPRDPRLLRMNRDLSSNPLTNDSNKSGKPLLLQEPSADLYNPVKINNEEIEDVSAHISKDMTSSSKTAISKKPWNLCIIQTSVDKPKPIYEPKHLSVIPPINKEVTLAIPKLSYEQKSQGSKDNIPDYAKFSKEITKGFKPSNSISVEKGEMYSPVSPERSEEPTKGKSVPQNEPGNDHKTWGFYREMLPRKSISDDTNSVSDEDSKVSVSKRKSGNDSKLNSERNSSMRAFSAGHCMNADSDDSDTNSNEDLTKPLYIDESASGTPYSDSIDHRLSPIKEMLKSLDNYDYDDDDSSCDATSWKIPSTYGVEASKSESNKKNLSHQQKSHGKDKNLFQSLSEDFGSVSQTETKGECSEKASSSDIGKLFSAYDYKGHEDSLNDTSHIWMKSLTTLSQAKAVSSLNISDEMMDMLRKVVKGGKDTDSPVSSNCEAGNKGQLNNNGNKSESEVESKCGIEEKDNGKRSFETLIQGEGGGEKDYFNKSTADSNLANKKNQTVSATDPLADETNSTLNTDNNSGDKIDEFMSGQAIPVLKPAKKRISVKRARSQSPTAFSSLKLFPPPNWLSPPSPFLVSPNPLKTIDWTPSTSPLTTSLHSQQLIWSPSLSMSQSLLNKNIPFPVGFTSPGLCATNPLLLNRPINPLMLPKQTDLADWFADKINPKSMTPSVSVAQPSIPSSSSVTESSSELETVSKETELNQNSELNASTYSENSVSEMISELQSTSKVQEKEKCELSRSSCYSPTDKTLELSSLSCLDHSQSSDSSKDGLAEKADNVKMKKSSSNELFVPSLISESSNSNVMPETTVSRHGKTSRKEASSSNGNDCDNDAVVGTAVSDTSKQNADDQTSATEGLNTSQDVDLLSENTASDDINNEVSKFLSYMGAKKRRSSKERSKSSSSSKSKQSKRSKHDDLSCLIPKAVQISTINSRKLKETSLPESNRKLLKELAKQFSKRKHKSDLQALLESVKKIKRELASQPPESSEDLSAGKTSVVAEKSDRVVWINKKEQQKSSSKRSSGEKGSSRSKHHKSSEKKWAENLWKPVKTVAEEKTVRSSDAAPIVINYKQKGSEKTDVSNAASTNSGNNTKQSLDKEKDGQDNGEAEKNEQNCDSELEEGELLDEDDESDNNNEKERYESMRQSESFEEYRTERWWHDKRDHPNDDRFYESNPGRPPRDVPWDMENKPEDYRHVSMDNYTIEQSEGYARDCYPLERAEPFQHNRMNDCPFPQPEGYSMNQMDNYPPEHDDSFPYNRPEDVPHNQMENYPRSRPDGNMRGKSKNYHGKRGHYPHGAGKFAPYPQNTRDNNLPEDSTNYEMEPDGYYSEEHKKISRGKSENYPRGKSNKYPFKRARRRSLKKREPSHDPDDYCQDKIDGFLYEKTDYYYDKGFQYSQSENYFHGNNGGYCSDKGNPFNCDNDNMVDNVPKYNQFNAWPSNEIEGTMQLFSKHGKSVFDRLSTKDLKSELGGRAYRGKQAFSGDASSRLEDGSIPFSNSKKKKLKMDVEDISYEELLEQTAKQLKEPLEDDEEKKCSSFDTIDEYVQMFVEHGCSEYNIIKKILGVSLDTRFDTMSKTRRKKIRKKIQSQLQALKQAPTINNSNESASLFPKIPMSSSESAAFNLDSIPGYSSLKSMSDSLEFLQNMWLNRRPEDEGIHNSRSSSEAQEDSDEESNSANNVDIQEDTNITDPEVKRAVHKVRANMISAAEKNGIGIPHQKIPLSLLLAEEKDSLYSSEGCFLILMRKIPTKSVERLVTLREVLDHINCEMQLAQKNNDALKFQTLQATKINLHERRKCVLENFTGLLNRKRLRLIDKACRKYQCCLDYMNANPDAIKDIEKEFVVKSLKAIQGHRSTVKNILENKDCNTAPPPPLMLNSQLPMGMTSSEPFRNESSMNGLEFQTALRFLVTNCHDNYIP